MRAVERSVGRAIGSHRVGGGRIGCRRRRWAQNAQAQGGQGQGGEGGGWHSCVPPWANWGGNQARPPATGNHAFDEYRAETLRRLEEEQVEFSSFLERLRFAKDKAEFDQFMAERRRPPVAPDEPNHA